MSRAQAVHEHSRQAYRAERPNLSARAKLVLEWVRLHPGTTDRDIRAGLGYADMNAIRPRVTELVEAGKLVEVGARRCPVTGKTVRVLDLSLAERGRS